MIILGYILCIISISFAIGWGVCGIFNLKDRFGDLPDGVALLITLFAFGLLLVIGQLIGVFYIDPVWLESLKCN